MRNSNSTGAYVCPLCVHVQMRLLCNLLCQCCHCHLGPNSINKYALQRDTHSVDEINILHTKHHLCFQQQTQTQSGSTVLISSLADVNASGGRFKWFIEGSLSQAISHEAEITDSHTYSSQAACLYSQPERRGRCRPGWRPGVEPASPTSVIKLGACGKDGLLGSSECADPEMKPWRSPSHRCSYRT